MKKRLLLLGTGGTIASEQTTGGLTPELSPAQLLRLAPSAAELCDVDGLRLFDLDSTNLTPVHWLDIARAIRDNYCDYDGFVITHGTDTMAYTAAALSYLIQGSKKPIILTGAQRPIGHESTDSRINLGDSFRCACSDAVHGVNVVLGGRVILGTRARKIRSKSFTAFSSINYPIVAVVQDGCLTSYITPEFRGEPLFFDKLDTAVGLIKLFPGLDAEVIRFMMERYDALIVESFGVGGLPAGGCREVVMNAAAAGKTVIMTTQVQNEGSDLAVYTVGRELKGCPGILEAYDMTTEAALAKMMWILDLTRDPREIARLFYTTVNRDILYRG